MLFCVLLKRRIKKEPCNDLIILCRQQYYIKKKGLLGKDIFFNLLSNVKVIYKNALHTT